MDFFNSKCKQFTSDEENQLIYTDIFNEYVKLIDCNIDQILLEKWNKEQLDEFYNDFKNDLKHYKDINYDVVDILFNAIDFQAFKETMLKFKSGLEYKEKDPNAKNLGDFGFETFF